MPQQPNVDILKTMMASQKAEEQKPARYSARFVKESFPDKHQIECGLSFSKIFWMRNDGEIAWPAGTQLLQTSGDNIDASVCTIDAEVCAGKTCELVIQGKAPEQEGRYTSFFRLQTGRIKFGHKVGCDIICVKPEEVPVVNTDLSRSMMKPVVGQESPVQMVAQDVNNSVADKEMADEQHDEDKVQESVIENNDKPSALMQSTISVEVKGPKDLYYEKVDALSDEALKQALKNLYEFGFTNFVLNKVLMEKHRNVNTVAEQLMTGALSESQFAAIEDDADLYD